MNKPKKVTSWRTCPNCGSRATKIFNLTTGKYNCQICNHKYTFTPTKLPEGKYNMQVVKA